MRNQSPSGGLLGGNWYAVKESTRQTSGVMWRSSVVHRLPSGIAPPGASLRDGYFRLNDPLPGLYYYAIHLFPLGVNKNFRDTPEERTPARAYYGRRAENYQGSERMAVGNTVIIGAGPYGLSIAAHLKAAGIPFALTERLLRVGVSLCPWHGAEVGALCLQPLGPGPAIHSGALLGGTQDALPAFRSPA